MATTTYSIIPNDITPEEYYQQAREQELAAANANTQANLAGLSGQVDTVNQNYDQIAQGIYTGLLQQERGAANVLAGRGLYDSGYADSQRIQMQNAAGQNLTQSELARQNSLRDIDINRQQIELGGQANVASIEANYNQALANFMYQKQQDELAAKTQAEQTALTNAYNAAEYGDFAQLQALGIDTTSAKKLYDAKVYSQALSLQQQQESLKSAQLSNASAATSAKKAAQPVDPIKQELAIQAAVSAIDKFKKQGSSPAEVMAAMLRSKDADIGRYGEAGYAAFEETMLNNYPGMSGYTDTSAVTPTSFSDFSKFLSDNKSLFYDEDKGTKNIFALGNALLESGMSDGDLNRAWKTYLPEITEKQWALKYGYTPQEVTKPAGAYNRTK